MSSQTRRTKAQKVKTAEKLLTYSYVADKDGSVAQTVERVGVQLRKNAVSDLFPYDIQLIYADLRKTMAITAMILFFLLGCYLKFR